jgi:uncharacterized membrane protein YccC
VSGFSPFGFLVGRRTELLLGLRITVAALLAFAVAQALALAQPYWAVLTAIIVVQASLGGSLKATADRIVGTVGGAAWGVVAAAFVPHETPMQLGLALAIAVLPLALVAGFMPTYRVAPITAVVILVGSAAHQTTIVQSAIDRSLEIGLGGAVALLVAYLIVPARAHGLLAEAAARAVEAMSAQMRLLAGGLGAALEPAVHQAGSDRIRAAIARAETLADEAARERAHHLAADAPDPEPILRNLRRLRNDLAVIGRAVLGEPLEPAIAARLAPALAEAGAAIADFLREAGAAYAERRPAPSLAPVADALGRYAARMAELRTEGALRPLSGEAASRVFGLAFALEQLRGNLEDLAARIDEMARRR